MSDDVEDLRRKLDQVLDGPLQKAIPPSSHQLARLLLGLPDRPLAIVKSEGNQCISEYILHPGGPWLDLTRVRIQIERQEEGVQDARRNV